jgi:integrase
MDTAIHLLIWWQNPSESSWCPGCRKVFSHLVTEGKVSASTQKQALNALVVLYREVIDTPLDGEIAPIRSKRLQRPPTVLTQNEVQLVPAAITSKHSLMAKILYGAGLRLMECNRLRVQDVDFGQGLIFVRGGKGGKDRTTILPKNLQDELRRHIEEI